MTWALRDAKREAKLLPGRKPAPKRAPEVPSTPEKAAVPEPLPA